MCSGSLSSRADRNSQKKSRCLQDFGSSTFCPVHGTKTGRLKTAIFAERWSGDPRAEERNTLLDTLGNLTLLTGGLNISSGNKGFLEKREKFAEHTGLFF
ncbi:HNH endonuclease family protein [Jhaorihella thermophila]